MSVNLSMSSPCINGGLEPGPYHIHLLRYTLKMDYVLTPSMGNRYFGEYKSPPITRSKGHVINTIPRSLKMPYIKSGKRHV